MRTDVTFISPPRPYLVNPAAQAPLGIMYLAAVCEAAGLSVRVANLSGVPRERWDSRLPESHCFAITGTFLDVPAVNELVVYVSRMHTPSRILVGGPISLSAAQVDSRAVVVHGEAERRIVDLVCGWLPDGEQDEADVGDIPLPARHLWPGPFGGNVFLGGRNWFGGGSTTLLTQRGCPMSCAFCAGPALCSRKLRRRPVADVVGEMEQCATDYGVRQFRLSDEYLTAVPAHVAELCEGIRASTILGHGKGLAWRASVATRPRSVGMFRDMVEAGCKEVSLGVESADPAVLDVICPGKTSPAAAVECLEMCRDAGLKTRALMMVGTPGSRHQTEAHTLEFFARAKYDGLAVTVFQPIPGSAIAANPGRYGCRLLRDPGSLCLYGPGGENELAPTVEVDGMTTGELSDQIRTIVAAAQATGKLGSG